MRKLIAGVGIAALALVFSGAAYAASVSDIFDDSIGTSFATWLIKVNMINHNGAGILNSSINASASSGGNSVSSADDQSATSITTGDTDSASLAQNEANTNVLEEEYDSADAVDNQVSEVSDSSTGEALSDDTLQNDMNNENGVEVDNDVDATSEAGANSVASGDSLTGASIGSGGAVAASGALSFFNTNFKSVLRHLVFGP